jgi:predicted RNase H-like HicB family nuclease
LPRAAHARCRGTRSPLVTHYIAILVAAQSGGWRVLFPDVPECQAHGHGLANIKRAAAASLTHYSETEGIKLRLPRTLEEIERDEEWLTRNNIDFDKAIVTIVPWPGDPFRKAVGNA